MISAQTIETVKQKLLETYDPLQIFLFGSYPWGTPDEESDRDEFKEDRRMFQRYAISKA